MDFFKNIKDGFSSNKKKLMKEFKKFSLNIINKVDKFNDQLKEEKILNAAIILTGCESPDNNDSFNVAGGIVGKGSTIVKLLERAMSNDDDFKNIVKKALSNIESNENPLVSAMVVGPDGKAVDINDNSLPDHIKETIKKMLSKGKSSIEGFNEASGSKGDVDDFSDDIGELEDEDY